MKKTLSLLLLFAIHQAFAQLKSGDKVPDLNFNTMLNATVKSINLNQLKGKVVVIDFLGYLVWVMPGGNAAFKGTASKIPKKLQVIAVTDETAKRAGMYIASKPSNLWFDADTGRIIAAVFPHQLIPHTILISAEGKFIAATDPESITNKVMDSVINKQQVHLPEKRDYVISHEDLIKQAFFAADTVQSRFMMLAEIKGGPGLSTTWKSDKIFSGRRLTCINLPLTTLYMLAYGNYPYDRTVDETKSTKHAPSYCLDLIVKTHAELLPALKKELAKRFDLQARIALMTKDVQVLRITDPQKFKLIPRNTTGQRTFYARHDGIEQDAITMVDFAEFLEDYGVNKLVVDDTNNQEKLDIKFSFQPENPQSLMDILAGMGLGLTKAQRQINMLVLYKQEIL